MGKQSGGKKISNYCCCFLLWREMEVEAIALLTGTKTNFLPVCENRRSNGLENVLYKYRVEGEVWLKERSGWVEQREQDSSLKVTHTLSCSIHAGSLHCATEASREKLWIRMKCRFVWLWLSVWPQKKKAFGCSCLMFQQEALTSANEHINISEQLWLFLTSRTVLFQLLFSHLCPTFQFHPFLLPPLVSR